MTEQQTKTKRPEFVNGVRVRMPQDYDFSSWGIIFLYEGKDYSSYNNDFKLRTDAVWEKQQLKDWFRLTNKCFFFNKQAMKYQFIQPQDAYSLILQPWGFEDQDISDWQGYSRTGVTTNYQAGIGPKQRVQSTFNSFYSMPDYYIMCAMRFQKWWRCDSVYGEDRSIHYDRNPEVGLTNLKDEDHYPCFRQWYQASYACADNIMKFLIQLSYAKKAQDFWTGDVSNSQIRMFSTVFDSPTAPQRVTFTY